MKKKEIFDICDQLGITYQAQDDDLNESLFYDGLNESLFYNDYYVGMIDLYNGENYYIYMTKNSLPKELKEIGLLDTKDKIIAALNFKIKSIKEYEVMMRQLKMESDFD